MIKKCWSIFLVENFRAVENHGASLIYCNVSSFQYFLMILDAFEAQTTGAFNALKTSKTDKNSQSYVEKTEDPAFNSVTQFSWWNRFGGSSSEATSISVFIKELEK